MSVDRVYTDKMRESFQTNLKKRVENMDPVGQLTSRFEVGYFYAAGLNFGKLLKNPNSSMLISEFAEVLDNAGGIDTNAAVLVFSRPQDVIYVMVDPVLYWVSRIRPIMLFDTKLLGEMAIVRLKDCLEELS